MPIRRHGSGWEVRVQHAGDRTSKTLGSYRDAQEYERLVRQRVADHRVGRAPSYTLEEAVERWLDGEARALQSYENLIDKVRLLYPYIKGRHFLDVADVAEEVKVDGIKAGLRPATINRRLAILRRVARLGFRRWEWLDRDIAGRIQLVPGEEPRTVKATPEQVQALLLAAAPRARQAIVWAALTGARQGELRRVRPEHFHGRALAILKSKTGRARVVPLAPGLRPQDFPFDLTDREVTKDFRAARERAGMPWLQFRDLRRSCGSWIVQRTRSLKAAQDILGHTTIAITATHYAHLLNEHLEEAVAALPRLSAGLARGKAKKLKAA